MNISVTINNQEHEGKVEPRKTLADFVREDLGLTGTKLGCEQGVCGACTVIVDGVAVRSCLMFAVQADGSTIQTVEGLSDDTGLHLIQETFTQNHALQCGFCTPGFLMSIYALLNDDGLGGMDMREALSGNICRCTGYQGIYAAFAELFEEGGAADGY